VSAAAEPYIRCPDCGFIAPPERMDYALTPDGEIDWDRPVHVTCLCCHASLTIGAGDVLPADTETTCHRCGAAAACPPGAARVQCPGCGLFLLGPDLTAAQRGELGVTEGLSAWRCGRPTWQPGNAPPGAGMASDERARPTSRPAPSRRGRGVRHSK
jgi:hypothetical protein